MDLWGNPEVGSIVRRLGLIPQWIRLGNGKCCHNPVTTRHKKTRSFQLTNKIRRRTLNPTRSYKSL